MVDFNFGKNFKNAVEKNGLFQSRVDQLWREREMKKGSQVKCLLRKIQWLSMEEDFHRCRWKKTTCGKFESVKVKKKVVFKTKPVID